MTINMNGILAQGAAPNKGPQTFFSGHNEGDTASYGVRIILDAVSNAIRNLSEGKAGGFSTYIASDEANHEAQMANPMMDPMSGLNPGGLPGNGNGLNTGNPSKADMAKVMEMLKGGGLNPGAMP